MMRLLKTTGSLTTHHPSNSVKVEPVTSVVDFFVAGTGSRVQKRAVFWVLVPPLIYAVYAGIGYVNGWQFGAGRRYPYFFLNWGSPAGAFGFTNELPFMGCVWWILAIMVFLLIIGYLYLLLSDIFGRRGGKREKNTAPADT